MKPEPTHEEFQDQVVQLARLLGWRHLHVRRTVGRGKRWTTATNVKGWPDLLLWGPGRGFVALELKVGRDAATPEQLAILDELRLAGAAAMVARPVDLEEVRRLLTERR